MVIYQAQTLSDFEQRIKHLLGDFLGHPWYSLGRKRLPHGAHVKSLLLGGTLCEVRVIIQRTIGYGQHGL